MKTIQEKWEFIENFLQRWRKNLIFEGFKREETYNSFIPTDKEIYQIIKEMENIL